MKPYKLIKYLRNQGLKGESLAEMLEVSRATVSNMENGDTEKMNFALLERTAQKLGIETADLIAKLEKVA